MSMGRGGMFGDPRLPMEKEQEEQMLRLLPPGLRGQIEQSQEMGGLLSPEDEAARFEAIGGLLAPERPQGFWQGGGKFGVKDGIAGLLAAAGDALMAQAGMGGGAVQGLAGTRMSAMDDLKKQAAQEQKMRELIAIGQANGLSEAQVRMQHAGLEGPKQPEPTGTEKLMQAAQGWGPEQWKLFGQLNPVQGADGRYYPREVPGNTDIGETLPPGWKMDGGGTGSGAGRFPVR